MAAGRRGRPYLVPEDKTALGDPAVNVNSRVGWLLLMSRLHHPDPELTQGEAFNAALRGVGLQADRSAVSRWESGKVTPRYSVLVAYERVLGLQPGLLTSVVNAQRRAFGGAGPHTWKPVLDPTSPDFHRRLDTILDRLLEGGSSGPGWVDLAHHVVASGAIYIQARVWRTLADSLVSEMSRSVAVAYLQRFEAVRLLLEHQRAHPWVLAATADYLADPDVQVINDPMVVLQLSNAPLAADVVLDLFLRTRSPMLLRAAITVIAAKVEAGAYGVAELASIEQGIAALLQDPGVSLTQLAELVETMPEPARSQLTRASRGLIGHEQATQLPVPAERFASETARKVSARLSEEVQERVDAANLYDDDKMTPRLIREALFASRHVLSHYASLALLGSPFRAPLADVLCNEVAATGLHDPLCGPYARLLRYLALPTHEERLLQWLPRAPTAVARDLALTVGHLASDQSLAAVLTMLDEERPSLDPALIYSLGMRQSTELTMLAQSEAHPKPHRVAAQWWLRQGGAVRT